ncbi:MAG: 2-oxoacid:acceptor oxidoreductase family protein [Candidatus Caldatribacteriota bacterium]
MLEEIIIAGFGGQGIMLIGRLIAYAGMLEGKKVAWMPSYGPEMRGGTANCTVIVSSEEIASPVVPNPHSLIVMNKPSLDKFEPMVKKDGLIILNDSLINQEVKRDNLTVIRVPANEIADQLGNLKIANMVMLGAYVQKTGIVKMETIYKALEKGLSSRNKDLLNLNLQALAKGAEIVK